MPTRRAFIAGTAAAVALGRPNIGRGADKNVIKFVPQGDLAVVDPIWTTATVTRNHAFLAYDTLFGQDETFQGAAANGRGRAGRGRRQGLDDQTARGPQIPRRHAGAGAGLRRQPEPLGQARCLRPDADGADGRAHRDRRPDVARQAEEAVPAAAGRPRQDDGLGPGDHAGAAGCDRGDDPGHRGDRQRAVSFRRERAPVGSSGGLREVRRLPAAQRRQARPHRWTEDRPCRADRMAHPAGSATAAAALQSGEIDWVEQPLPDILPLLAKDPKLEVAIKETTGSIAIMRMNHLHPPSTIRRSAAPC